MREILFNGKRVDTGEWVEGYLLKVKTLSPSSAKWVEKTLILIQQDEIYEVFPETVGQYTGLTDKNGKKIFEGYIIKADNWLHSYMKIYTIVFEDGGFYAKYKDEDGWNFDHLGNIAVIGNVFDNPELIEVK
jgi:uncharacterized phage protein (TIGR01671 family)